VDSRSSSTCALVAWLWAAGCGGSSSTGGVVAPVGTWLAKPEGSGTSAGHYFADEHASGRASRLALVEITWGRLVDVHALDEDGRRVAAPVLRDFVVHENIQDELGRYALETSPATQKTRLVIQRTLAQPDFGDGDFVSLLRHAAQGLPGVLPKSADASTGTPFSFVARNAVLMLRFDDLLQDDEESRIELTENVRVLIGYPPTTPMQARIEFDPNHGGVVAGRFHSTRVLVDPTVSEAEALDSPGLPLNALGLPRSERLSRAADVALRLPTRTDPGSGQFTVLRNLSGSPIDPVGSGPFDAYGPTLALERALRSGNEEDLNNGFLLDFSPPRIVGGWACSILAAQPASPSGFDWLLDLDFATACRKTPEVGDIVVTGECILEVDEPALPENRAGAFQGVHARVIDETAPRSGAELLGAADYRSLYRQGLALEPGCWLRFSPAPRGYPSLDVDPAATATLRFSEPMDPASARAFDSFMTIRGGPSTSPASTNLVLARLAHSLDLHAVTIVPSVPFAHGGERLPYHIRILAAGGITDLAGNELVDELPPIEFTIDPQATRHASGQFVLRFESPDELEPHGAPDLRGQFTYDFARGVVRSRAPSFSSVAIDGSVPMVSIMTPFAPGVATPLSPFGSKLHALWRYADLGWSIRDESKYDLDVTGLSWSPALGGVSADFFERFEIRLAHSKRLPDEALNRLTLVPIWLDSGLFAGPTPFQQNLLASQHGSQTVVHERAFGYRVEPRDLFRSSSGTPLMPYPMQRAGSALTTFTWRDTSVLTKGGDLGVGVPLDIEVGPPLALENEIGTFAGRGEVPSVGMPLLMEFRCYPSSMAIGLNALAVQLACNTSAAPNFRAFSTGGFNTLGVAVSKDPDLETAPTGGFNPLSQPPGKPTRYTADNALYVGQLDYVIRVSRAHTIWIDTGAAEPRYAAVVLEPDAAAQPPGTEIQLDFRGADRFDGAGAAPFDAAALTTYGDPRVGSTAFHGAGSAWSRDVHDLDGARYFQMRFTFVNNIQGAVSPELSAVGVAFEFD
jgi:hypothetical protein